MTTRFPNKGISLAGSLLILSALAWSEKSAGTNGAGFLKIGVSARAAALGEAVTAVADDAGASIDNPAGLGGLGRSELMGTHAQWIEGGRHDAWAGVLSTKVGAFAVNALTLSYDGIERRAQDTDAADGTFGSLDAAYGLAYGRSWSPHVSWGAGVTYVRQTLGSVSAGSPTVSLGALWKTPFSFLTVGAAVRNIGGTVRFQEEADPLPTTTTAVGAAGRFIKDRWLISVEARWVRAESPTYGAGTEFSWTLYKEAVGHLRAGYRSDPQAPTDATGLSLGVGFGFRRWGFDVGWIPAGVLGDTYRYTLRYRFE